LAGHLPFDDFAREYSRVFIDAIPDSALSAAELSEFGEINEKAELTGPAPSAEDRKYGWMDVSEVKAWLAANRLGSEK
jgi:hypothetical protein